MEKIIAVVIMIVIVIGLIATVVIPQGEQTKKFSQESTSQMNSLTDTVAGAKSVSDLVSSIRETETDKNLEVYVAKDVGDTYTITLTGGAVSVTGTDADTTGTPSLTVAYAQNETNIDADAKFKTDERADANGVRHLVYYRINSAK